MTEKRTSSDRARRTQGARPHARPRTRPSVQRRSTAAAPPTRAFPIAAIAVIVAAILVLVLVVSHACQGPVEGENAQAGAQAGVQAGAEGQTAAGETAPVDGRVTLLAVGDNTPNDNVGAYADALAGAVGDDKYDYRPIFQPVAPLVQAADLAYMNEETTVGGNEIGPQGYPNFNTTDEMADAVVETGFDLVATANNHSYDYGSEGALEHSVALWNSLPVDMVGTATTDEQYNRIVTRECNGITFALLNYTYGLNGYEAIIPDGLVHLIDEDAIAADVARAHEAADVVLVAMHWGNEHETEESDEQRELAQLLADLDVDLVIGAHPHVIQPMEWVENANGSGHRTLVTYSLGNFLIDHADPLPENVLEGMLTCDFVRDDAGKVGIENIMWTPLVLHVNDDQTEYAVYPADDYTAELAAANRGLAGVDDPLEWVRSRTREIVGAQWF